MNASAAAPDLRARIARGDGAQVVAFRLGGALHGCDIQLVEEVLARPAIHPLPDLPEDLLGVMLLRGELLPVVDVAPALGLGLGAPGAVLVVGVGEWRLGVAAEGAAEVVEVPAEALRPAPHAGGDRDAYVVGVARVEAGLVTLIDLAEALRERTILHTGD